MNDFSDATKASRERVAMLDGLDLASLIEEIGQPTWKVKEYRPGGAWVIGSGRPFLASDDPAVIQAMARCLTWRVMKGEPKSPDMKVGESLMKLDSDGNPLAGAIHPRKCWFCDYQIDQVRLAVDHGGFMARYVETAFVVWVGENDSKYTRGLPIQGTYENPRWAEFFTKVESADDRAKWSAWREKAIQDAMYGDPVMTP